MGVTKIRLTGALLLTALAATGCAPDVERLDGQAAPAGIATPATTPPTSAPAPSAPATSAPATSTPATPSTASSPSPGGTTKTSQQRLVLGPNGLGGLKLRMTREQAEATGLIEGYEVEDFTGNCGISRLRSTGDTVYFTPGLGLSNIVAPDGVRTPEGIRIGSTLKELQKAYPTWENLTGSGGNGYGWVKVPGNSRNLFRLDVRDSKVSFVVLTTEGQKCVE